jgi:hypothetical protein
MPTVQSPLLSYEEVPKFVWIATTCGRVARVSACRSLLGSFESVSWQSVQRCTWVWCGCFKSWMKNDENKENEERRKKMKREVKPESAKYCYFVSTWPSWIVMTDQSRWISRADRSAILVTALFYSRPDFSVIYGHSFNCNKYYITFQHPKWLVGVLEGADRSLPQATTSATQQRM